MCQSHYENRLILKYADDSVVVSLLRGGESSHGPVIDDFLRWCDDLSSDKCVQNKGYVH